LSSSILSRRSLEPPTLSGFFASVNREEGSEISEICLD
jgi:hypothetical protein